MELLEALKQLDWLGLCILAYMVYAIPVGLPRMIYLQIKWLNMLFRLEDHGLITHYEREGLYEAFRYKLIMIPYWWRLYQVVDKEAYEYVNKLLTKIETDD